MQKKYETYEYIGLYIIKSVREFSTKPQGFCPTMAENSDQ